MDERKITDYTFEKLLGLMSDYKRMAVEIMRLENEVYGDDLKLRMTNVFNSPEDFLSVEHMTLGDFLFKAAVRFRYDIEAQLDEINQLAIDKRCLDNFDF